MSAEEQLPIGSPEVASRVAEILRAAEADARAIIAAAHEKPTPAAVPAGTLDLLAERLDELEARLLERLDALEALLRAQLGVLPGSQEPDPLSAVEDARFRAARVRAVDLALQGRSRAQIAAELTPIVGAPTLERLLADVFEER
jgi:hypothetical protein